MIRGGGDKAGLYELNTEYLASLICRSPLPVIVGIGHERDNTILDEVACLRCPTPSMVIGHIVGTIVENAQGASASMKAIKMAMSQVTHRARMEVKTMMSDIKYEASVAINDARQRNEHLMTTIKHHQSTTLRKARSDIKLLMKDILLQNPKNVLEHGYAVVRAGDTVVTSAAEAKEYTELTIQFKDGKVSQ